MGIGAALIGDITVASAGAFTGVTITIEALHAPAVQASLCLDKATGAC